MFEPNLSRTAQYIAHLVRPAVLCNDLADQDG